MKFETNLEQFSRVIVTVARFAERKPNLPVLGSVLIVAENGHLLLRATNLECGVEITTPAKVSESGIVAIPAGVLSGFVGNARGKTITGFLRGEVCILETEQASATLKTIPPEDFPLLPKVSAEHSFTLKSNELARALRAVVYCASTSTVKPELQSVLICGSGELSLQPQPTHSA